MKQRDAPSTSLPRYVRLLLPVLAMVAVVEIAIMFLLPVLVPNVGHLGSTILDGAILISITTPLLWWFLIRPLRNAALMEHVRAEMIIARAFDGIITMNDQGLIELFSPAAERLFGYGKAEVLGEPMTRLMPERYRDAHRRAVQQRHSADTRDIPGRTIELHGLRKDGSEFPLDLSLATWNSGGTRFSTGIIRDITERKRAQERLERLSHHNELVLNAAGEGIYGLDLEGRTTFINPAAARMLGWNVEELLGKPMHSVLHHSKPDGTLYPSQECPIYAAFRDGAVRHCTDEVFWRKDGTSFPVEYISTPLRENGELCGAVVTFNDVSAQKHAEATRQALYQASLEIQEPLGLQDRLDRLLHTAQTILELDRVNILLADSEGQWLEAVASLGTEEPLTTVRVPIGPEGGALAEAYRTRQMIAWDGRAPVPASLRLQPPYDQIKAFRSRAFALVPLVVQGRAIGLLGADRKHTRRPLEPATLELLQLFVAQAALAIEHGRLYDAQRQAAAQLEATVEVRTRELQTANAQFREAAREADLASRHKSEFLANMSHELRTPLNSILGFSELLTKAAHGPLTEKQTRYVQNISTSGTHLLTVINDLLDLAKVEAGRIEIRPQPFVLREALAQVLAQIRPQAEVKQQRLDLDMPGDLGTLTADPLRVKQMLYNLLSNAVKFTPAGGSITVTARRASSVEREASADPSRSTLHGPRSALHEFLEIAVADTGIGITAEDLPKLFAPFTQLDAAFDKRYQGTGLGLALTKQLVELHGGQVWATSEGKGRGSTFTLVLPFAGPGHAGNLEDGPPGPLPT